MNICLKLKLRRDYLKNRHNLILFKDYVSLRLRNIVLEKSLPSEFEDRKNDNVFRLSSIKEENNNCFFNNCSFILERPEGMDQEDVFKIVACVRRSIKTQSGFRDESKIVLLVQNELINSYGFTPVLPDQLYERKIIDLLFIDKYSFTFYDSPFWKSEFNWYHKYSSLTYKDLENIYNSLGLKIKLYKNSDE